MATAHITEKPAGLRREHYRGAETPAVYSEVGQEFTALINGAGIYDLSWRAKLLVTGKDRVRWLNGMITNNVRDLPAGKGTYNFLLTPQGRILGDLYAYNRGESLILDTDQRQVENMIAVFRRYIIMDKVEIANAAEQLAALAIAGPNAGEVLSKLGLNVSNMEPLDVRETTFNDVTVTFVRGDWPVMSYELWTHPANSGRLWQELVNIGATPAGSESVELLRIACGIPTYGQDIRERDLPHETEQLRALNFTKGCYIGQEIVERIRARGAVHRKLTGFRISGSLPVPGTKAKADGKEVAEVTSSAALPLKSGELQVALGYVRREIAPGGKEFQLGDAKATVVELPFAEALAVTSE